MEGVSAPGLAEQTRPLGKILSFTSLPGNFKITIMGKVFHLFLLLAITGCMSDGKETYKKWEVYGGDSKSLRYSALDQVNRDNVKNLKVAWSYHSDEGDSIGISTMYCSPIVIGRTLFGVSPSLRLFAVDAMTGEKKWSFDPHCKNRNRLRGLSYWEDGEDRRLLYPVDDSLYAINADNGKPVESFGDSGKVDLHEGLGEMHKQKYITATSPGIIYKDLIIIGSSVSEGAGGAPGHIRAFNVRTGKLEWVFHTIPQPGEFGFDTWEDTTAWKVNGAANNWGGMSLDEERGIVFVPTGSVGSDFYGGGRKGINLFANCVLALDAQTGKRVWHFQTIHHDLWDRDLPCPPSLVTVNHNGKRIDAVAQPTKTGVVFLLDRETGRPIFPVVEQPVSTATTLKGEKPWPTQPVPVKPKPFMRQSFSDTDINRYASEEDKKKIAAQLREFNNGNMFDPPTTKGNIMIPWLDGGAEWGGGAFDIETGLFYVNSNEVPWIVTVSEIKRKAQSKRHETVDKLGDTAKGNALFMANCSTCHGADHKGTAAAPNILGAGRKYSTSELLTLINEGRRTMPGFKYLSDADKASLVKHIKAISESSVDSQWIAPPVPYALSGLTKMITSEGVPAINPPWGTLSAIDLNSGEIVWRKPLGEYPQLKAKGIPATGTENYGGPVVTAGGLVFIAAASDAKLRAFDKTTGEILWEGDLPTSAFTTPCVYEIDGKQFIVVSCGGGKLGAKSGDSYVAFSLP